MLGVLPLGVPLSATVGGSTSLGAPSCGEDVHGVREPCLGWHSIEPPHCRRLQTLAVLRSVVECTGAGCWLEHGTFEDGVDEAFLSGDTMVRLALVPKNLAADIGAGLMVRFRGEICAFPLELGLGVG